jgi:hypothetical protein
MSDTHVAATAKAGTDHGFEGNVKRLGKYVGQLHDDLAGVAREMGGVAQSGMAAAKEDGRTALDAAKRKRDRASASLRGSIARHPGASLGIAVGVGILLGLVGSAIIRSRRDSE